MVKTLNVVSISRSSRTVCPLVHRIQPLYARIHIEFTPFESTPSWPCREPAASVDRRELRNWIVILFSKAICKCYQKFSGHACHSPLATRPRRSSSLPFSRLVFPAFSEPRTRRIDATPMGSTSEFRIFRRISRDERDEGIRHGKLLSEIPTTTRFQPRVYWPLDLAHVAIFAQFDARK